jgi:hypothetical protein
MKHTPGPWKVIKNPNIHKIHFGMIDSEKCSIGSVSYETENAEANAKLIAAAPDLLEACKGMMAILETLDFDWINQRQDEIHYDNIPWEQWESAIKKATGGEQWEK